MLCSLSVATHAAQVYNKDGNTLDFYGKVKAEHYITDNTGSDGDQSYARLGFKGVTRINDQLAGYGQWEYQYSLKTPKAVMPVTVINPTRFCRPA